MYINIFYSDIHYKHYYGKFMMMANTSIWTK